MTWIMNQYEKYHGFSPACVTGKPVDLHGAEGREEATGRGVGIIARCLAEKLKKPISGSTVALQGFGNVGSFCGKFLHDMGAKVVAISDAFGGVYNKDGLEVQKLQAFATANGKVTGFPESESISNAELLAADVDILIPAALGGVLHKGNAGDVRAKAIIEAANGPTTPEADEIFEKKGILVVPDILANAGGVTVSYFEWVQNRQYFKWKLDQVREQLESVMTDSFERVWNVAEEKKVHLRTAAYILGIGRVGRATVTGGI
jgi:glutamate dehydrogenase (NAD(P)+)